MEGVNGLRLYRQAWLPDADPRATVVLAHGAGEHSGRYAHVAKRLTDEGYALYTLDHRGHGKSDGRRADIDRIAKVVADLRSLISLARAEHPDRKLFLLGHSMGGCIALAYACDHQDEIDGLLLTDPAISLETASPITRLISKVLGEVVPGLGVFGVDPTTVSRDPDVVHNYETDPLVHHGKLPARTIGELTRAAESFPQRVPGLTLPLIVMHGTDDPIVPLASSELLYERVSSADKTIKLYEGLYHEILNEPEQGEVLDDIVAWLEAHL